MEEIRKKLENLKTEIDRTKQLKAQQEGRKAAIMTQAKKEFGVESITDLSALLEEKEHQLLSTEQQIKILFEKLEKEYEW